MSWQVGTCYGVRIEGFIVPGIRCDWNKTALGGQGLFVFSMLLASTEIGKALMFSVAQCYRF